jgi:glucokinase
MHRASQQTMDSLLHAAGTDWAGAATLGYQPFLAADVGGTHARIALIDWHADTVNGNNQLDILHYRKFACADYPGLVDILREFIASIDGLVISNACIACAGYLLGDVLINANLPWQVSLSAIRRELALEVLSLINDFEAVAYATHFHAADESILIAGNGPTRRDQPRLVVGPGTGLGAAVLFPREPRPGLLGTEAGHAGLTACSTLELQIVQRIGNGSRHVASEHILSGPGLVTLYRTLGEIRGLPSPYSTPAQITAAALVRSNALANESVDVFCAWLGSVVGDLVLAYGAHGGVFLAGGVLPQILPLLQRSAFAERFYAKGTMREVLEQTPVRLIEHGQLGVTGAAHWFIDHALMAGTRSQG